jgi:hypothetical protein
MCSFYVHTDRDREFCGVTAEGWSDPKLVDLGPNDAGEAVFSADGCRLILE